MQRFVFFPGAIYAGSGGWTASIAMTRDGKPAGVRVADEPHATQREAIQHALDAAHTAAAAVRAQFQGVAEYVVHVPAHNASAEESADAARAAARDPGKVIRVRSLAQTVVNFLSPRHYGVPA